MDKCVFCDSTLAPGSEEHLFLSALGARTSTRRATCSDCNNAFSSKETGKVDDALADAFVQVRNGLKIWSGRGKPPPTLKRAGRFEEGGEFDLAPGFTPVARPGQLPKNLMVGAEYTLQARDEADVHRQLDILKRRGVEAKLGGAFRVKQQVPGVHFRISFDGPLVWRCIGKTAVVAAAVLFGNEKARAWIDPELRRAIRYGDPLIERYVGWDYANEWPQVTASSPHARTPNAALSGFEHSIIITDVGDAKVAYVTLFGGWKFSVRLGARTGLPGCGLAVNPRASMPARFELSFINPTTYTARHEHSLLDEHSLITSGVEAALKRVLEQSSREAQHEVATEYSEEICTALEAAGFDEVARASAIDAFVEKLATLEMGKAWKSELQMSFDEDSAS